MKSMRYWGRLLLGLAVLIAVAAQGAEYPLPTQGDWVDHGFRFHTGEVLDLRVHYATVGPPTGEPVIVLHGTAGSAASMLTPAFAGELFGPGLPLDATRYFIVLPDAIGHGGSSKPSDGLRTKFPGYDYDDMLRAQHDLVTRGLGIRRARLVIGFSMGGMQAWMWGEKYPDFMDALVPMASQPTPMSSRNWMMRRLIIDSIRNDPDWKGGKYGEQPRSARFASVFYGIVANGGTLAYQKIAPTREQADQLLARWSSRRSLQG
jgi:homoserine O-acetyltransferase